MKPVSFCCVETLSISGAELARQILDLTKWPYFTGYAFLPGIKAAEFEVRTAEIVGSRFRVVNTDGSSHVEEILEWDPDRQITMHMKEFSPPLSRLATHFEERWVFAPAPEGTKVTRCFRLYAKRLVTWPLLWAISIFLQKAIARNLEQMRSGIPPAG